MFGGSRTSFYDKGVSLFRARGPCWFFVEGAVERLPPINARHHMLVFEEDGKYIFAPGGNLTVFLSNSEMPEIAVAGRVAFGWWEERH